LRGTWGASVFSGWSIGGVLTLACLLLFLGACGKSAQLPLYAWLPDAMAGPTPVSALIHAATMVTAGVYLVARLNPLYELAPAAQTVVAFTGALTALFAALCALTQTDIKKVLAYSTVSQLGFMFLAAGVGAWAWAMFHVVTHAFFKALLFLAAGSIIHALNGEQDLTRMGGLRRRLPITFWTMLSGALALAGLPFTSGWFSKDGILEAVLERAATPGGELFFGLLYAMGTAAAFCTAFYIFRLVSLAFFGRSRLPSEVQAHEAPPVMTAPLLLLAVLACGAGLAWGAGNRFTGFLAGEAARAESHGGAATLNLVLTSCVAVGGAAAAFFVYAGRSYVPNPAAGANPLVRVVWNRFYLDRFYMQVVTPVFELAAELLYLSVDVLLLDTLLVAGLGGLTKLCGAGLRALHTGLTNAYAAGALIGALLLLYWLLRN
jgi:NADH-quinone oxidoreductase subunit L